MVYLSVWPDSFLTVGTVSHALMFQTWYSSGPKQSFWSLNEMLQKEKRVKIATM